jgi:hypothetical protein
MAVFLTYHKGLPRGSRHHASPIWELVQGGPRVVSIARRSLWPDGTCSTQKTHPGSKAKDEQVVELDREARQPTARKEWPRSQIFGTGNCRKRGPESGPFFSTHLIAMKRSSLKIKPALWAYFLDLDTDNYVSTGRRRDGTKLFENPTCLLLQFGLRYRVSRSEWTEAQAPDLFEFLSPLAKTALGCLHTGVLIC